MPDDQIANVALLTAWKEERLRIVAGLARRLGDLELAEDAVQEAYAIAAVRWATHGVPERPGAWLTTTAWHQAVDFLRRNKLPTTSLEGIERVEAAADPVRTDEDPVFGMLLACCHPALDETSRIALTLRHVAGLEVSQISAALLVSDAALQKRLVRARKKIRLGGISFEVPDAQELEGRLDAVRSVIYLIFTEGHHPSDESTIVGVDLCEEAIWMARQLRLATRGDPETAGLLALMMLQHSRAGARRAASDLIAFDDQDRNLWDRSLIESARALLAETGNTAPGRYRLEAAIALHHASVGPDGDPSWATIADLYGVLFRMTESPIVGVNRAHAIARATNASAGLSALSEWLTHPKLQGYAPMHAAHAWMLEQLGQPAAADAWRQAEASTSNTAQRAQITKRLASLAERSDPGRFRSED